MKESINRTPDELITLYKHWSRIRAQAIGIESDSVDPVKLEEISVFARKRMETWAKRSANITPTSDDPIIAKFKFCNVYRELDKQTIFFHQRLKNVESNFEKWLLNMFASRFIANIETIKKIGLLDVGTEDLVAMGRLKKLPKPKYGNAYVFPISTIKNSSWPTREEFLYLYVPMVIAEVAKVIQGQRNGSVSELLDLILPVFGFKQRFLWTEVLIDLHYQFPELVDLNRDFHIGPGAMPSLKYLRSSSSDNSEQEVLEELAQRHFEVEGVNLFKDGQIIPLTAENWEGICCEFRKYRNLSMGVGRRRHYINS